MARLNQRQDTVNPQSLDLLRRKFGAQNRAIAKSHAALEDKIAQLEHATGQLMNENYDLRCENIQLVKEREYRNSQIRQILQDKFDEIEQLLTFGGDRSASLSHGPEPGDQLVQLGNITKRKRKGSDEDKTCEEENYDREEINAAGTVVEDSIPEEDESEFTGVFKAHIECESTANNADKEVETQDVAIGSEEGDAMAVEAEPEGTPSFAEPEPEVKPEPEQESELELSEPSISSHVGSRKPPTSTTNSRIIKSTGGARPKATAGATKKKTNQKPAQNDKSADNSNIVRQPLGAKNVNEVPKPPKPASSSKSAKPKEKQPPRKKQKTLPIENETMPQTIMSPPRRRRSSRGSQVNYALPSLRTKMRRDHNELVDAVDVLAVKSAAAAADGNGSGDSGSRTSCSAGYDAENGVSELVEEVKKEIALEEADPKITTRRASTGGTSAARRKSTRTRKSMAT